MFKQDSVIYEMDSQITRTNRNTGKEYKAWHWSGWSTLPNLEVLEHKLKGKWLIVTSKSGSIYRYNMESKNVVDYTN